MSGSSTDGGRRGPDDADLAIDPAWTTRILTRFVRAEHSGILIVDSELDPLLERMARYEPHRTIFQMKADEL